MDKGSLMWAAIFCNWIQLNGFEQLQTEIVNHVPCQLTAYGV